VARRPGPAGGRQGWREPPALGQARAPAARSRYRRASCAAAERSCPELSQEQLAARAYLSRVTLGSIERGRRASNLLHYLAIARELNVDIGDLLTQRRA
jgi:DNA-binding XRE family transcriptional regulator